MLEDKDQYGQFALSVGPSMMVGLRLHDLTSDNDAFDPFRVGLDHYGVHVESTDELVTPRGGRSRKVKAIAG